MLYLLRYLDPPTQIVILVLFIIVAFIVFWQATPNFKEDK